VSAQQLLASPDDSPFRQGACWCLLGRHKQESALPVIPQLVLPDPDAARAQLARHFGFRSEDGLMLLGTQAVTVVAGPAGGHGVIDHLALAVPDVEAAVAGALARGAVADLSVTPDGALEIPEFHAGGVRYLFLQGPGGARIEMIQNLAAPHGPGHDHIGIPCSDIAASAAFLAGLGAVPLSAATLRRAGGETQVRFLALAGSVLELYQPPVPPRPAAMGLWRCLRVPGILPVTGPDGLTLAPI
jgi:catechol 2,3-dioxygenase-like lactoylglutathione lyase family enzyme